jgi:hypothetical protein
MNDSETIRELRRSLSRAANLLSYIIEYQREDPRGEDTFDDRTMTSYREEFRIAAHDPELFETLVTNANSVH